MYLQEHINSFEKNKLEIVKSWLENKEMKVLIDNYDLDKNLFIERYAFGILDCYIDTIKKDKNLEDCIVIDDFLKYLKKYNIRFNELFTIFFALKNALIKYIFKLNIQSVDIIGEVDSYFEQKFSIIIDKYSKKIDEVEHALSKSTDIVDKYVLMTKSDLKGTIIGVTNAFCELSGYYHDELIGKPFSMLKHPDSDSNIFNDLWQTILKGDIWQGELKNQKKNGDFYWLKTTIQPNFDKMGNIINYVAINQNITSQKNFQNQQDLLVEQSKSAAMGDMISMIAHQWRQPLQAVSILVQKLPLTKMIDGHVSDELLDSVVEEVSLQLNYMSKTIDDFRDYFKPNKEKQKIHLEKLINKAIDFLSYLFKIDSIKLTINNSDNIEIEIYLNEIIQVLINLIKNSRDAMIENSITDKKIDISTYNKDDKVYIEIQDNAGGIPSDIIGKIFEPYFSTKMNKNGTGLGLYMSKTIVEQHSDGKLSVLNIDNGAKFIIELPLK